MRSSRQETRRTRARCVSTARGTCLRTQHDADRRGKTRQNHGVHSMLACVRACVDPCVHSSGCPHGGGDEVQWQICVYTNSNDGGVDGSPDAAAVMAICVELNMPHAQNDCMLVGARVDVARACAYACVACVFAGVFCLPVLMQRIRDI